MTRVGHILISNILMTHGKYKPKCLQNYCKDFKWTLWVFSWSRWTRLCGLERAKDVTYPGISLSMAVWNERSGDAWNYHKTTRFLKRANNAMFKKSNLAWTEIDNPNRAKIAARLRLVRFQNFHYELNILSNLLMISSRQVLI